MDVLDQFPFTWNFFEFLLQYHEIYHKKDDANKIAIEAIN